MRRRRRRREEKKEERRRKKDQRYGNYDFGMELYGNSWNSMDFYGLV